MSLSLLATGAISEQLSNFCEPVWRANADNEVLGSEFARLASLAIVDQICDDGSTALHFARTAEHVELMTASGADPNIPSKDGITPIFAAAAWGSADAVRALAAAGAKPDILTEFGEAPLHVAIQYGETDAVEALLQVGARTSIIDRNGLTPMDLALRYGNTEIVGLLRQFAATHIALDFGFGSVLLSQDGLWSEPIISDGGIRAHKTLSSDHSIVARISVVTEMTNRMAYILAADPYEYLEFRLAEIRQQLDDGRFPIKFFEAFAQDFGEATCLGYELAAKDLENANSQGNLFEIRAVGFACSIPRYAAYLEYDYSERRSPDELPSEGFYSEARNYFESLVIY